MHHWAALIFVASICLHMLRIFFSGAFRKPRELNWLIGVTMLLLAIAEGFAGYSLPDDLLSGTGLRTFDGILLSIPIVGSYLSYFVFGGQFPGHDLIPRLFTVHILLIPGLLLGLITVHLLLVFYQKHTQWPEPGHKNTNVVGKPMIPVYAAKSGGLLFVLFGLLALFGGLVQINPVWLFGPYQPYQATTSSQPDWYMNFLEGALRLMPNWQSVIAGRDIVWNVFVPGVLVPGALFTTLYAYPFVEAWITGDGRERHLLDRPRDRPTRTAFGAAGVCFFAVLTFAGSDDVAATVFRLSVNDLVWTLRVAVLVLPPVVFLTTRRLCMQLQRADRRAVLFGRDSGVVTESPDGGGYGAAVSELDAGARYTVTARDNGPQDPHRGKGTGIRGLVGWIVRLVLVHWVRRHRVRKPTAAQYRLARRGQWTAADEEGDDGLP
jgi:ubiquinol-cytochrome c reductase cytochrome b subunit